MRSEPYSIYVDRRPLRIAFLMNPGEGIAWIDKIIEYNRERWGGRFNPIILTDGIELRDDWREILKASDPDLVASTVPLGDRLKRRIANFLSPLAIEQIHDSSADLRMDHYDPLGILPSSKVVSQVARDFIGDRSALVVFDVAPETPPIIHDFVRRNFGLIDTGPGALYHVRRALEGMNTVAYRISDATSLNDALLDLGTYRRVVFPCQLCTLPNRAEDVAYAQETNHFAVILGDGPDELAYFWNRTLLLRNWLRTRFTHLWLPSALAAEPALRTGLTKFLSRFVDATGDSQSKGAYFYSFSLDEAALTGIAQDLGGGTRYWHSSRRLLEHPVPSLHPRLFGPPRELELHRAQSSEEYLLVDPPDDIEGATEPGRNWLADLYIEYRPERLASMMGTTRWWRLPRRNSVLAESRFFNRPARIKADGSFSVLMGQRSMPWDPGRELIVKIPSDFDVAAALICGEHFDGESQSSDKRLDSHCSIDLSDKGMYLSGVLGLFPDLSNAYSVFESRFWRKTFERMSNASSSKDKVKQEEVARVIRKGVRGWDQLPPTDDQLSHLAGRLLNLMKGYAKKEQSELRYAELLKAAKEENDAYNEAHPENPFRLIEKEFSSRISDLLELKVLLVGIRPQCPSCGYRIWYHVDEVTQEIRCTGCGNMFSVPAEEHWHYRLNSLLRAAVGLYGTIPLLLVLGQLMRSARSSFMFVPPVDLLEWDDDLPENRSPRYRQVGELDVVCVADGRFIIGEVKKSVGLFDAADFDRLIPIAKRIKPDTVLFAALEGSPGKLVKDHIERLQAELSEWGIEVKWFPLREWISEPRPVW